MTFNNPDFARVAEAMGAKGIRIEDPADVRDGLASALAHKNGPVVVDAVVDAFALSLPSHVPFHTVRGFTLSMAKQVWGGKTDDVYPDDRTKRQSWYERGLPGSSPAGLNQSLARCHW